MAHVLVLGAGVMGSAFAQLLVDAGNEVRLVGTHLDGDIIYSIRANGTHPKLGVRLPTEIRPYTHDQLASALDGTVGLIVFGVSSAGVDWATAQIGPLLQAPPPILMLTKGLGVHNGSIVTLPQIVEHQLTQYGDSHVPLAAVGGPCIAGELAARRQSSVVVASGDSDVLEWLLGVVDTTYYHARGSDDLIGVEACAALKNFYTLAVGYASGRLEVEQESPNGALMHNLAAGIFTQAVNEMMYLTAMLGGRRTTATGLAGVGDLYVTCQAGRNGRMGKLLGSGLLYRHAISEHMRDTTVEGADLAIEIGETLRQNVSAGIIDGTAIPLALCIVEAICDNRPMQLPWSRFYRR